MKLILVITATVLLPVGMATAAWADDSTAHPVQPGAAALNTQPAEVTESSENEADRLNGLETRINQSVGRSSRNSESTPSVNQLLNLPEDTVIRGTPRGGLAIGREF